MNYRDTEGTEKTKEATSVARFASVVSHAEPFGKRPLATPHARPAVSRRGDRSPSEKMSRVEKLRAMEEIWADLSRDEDKFDSPAWHAEALRETERAVASGKAKFVDWEEAKKRLRRKAARLS